MLIRRCGKRFWWCLAWALVSALPFASLRLSPTISSTTDARRAETTYDPLRDYWHMPSEVRSGFPVAQVEYNSSPCRKLGHESPSATVISAFSTPYGLSMPVFRKGQTMGNCPFNCSFLPASGNAGATQEADVVVFDAHSRPPIERRKHQTWVGYYWEAPDTNHAILQDAAHMALFDYMIGFMPYDDVFLPSMVYDTFKYFNTTKNWKRPSFEQKKARPLMSVWMSNCHMQLSQRVEYLAELKRNGVTVASYGACERTSEPAVPNTADKMTWENFAHTGAHELLIAASTAHLFFFAAENSKCSFYHTEKVYNALVAGSVPVYIGSCSTLREFVPTHSVIMADDCDSAEALANHLHYLAGNETAYSAYLSWRDSALPFPPAWKKLATLMQISYWIESDDHANVRCALCQFFSACLTRRIKRPIGCVPADIL